MTTLAARLRHRITFESQLTVRDSDGIATLEWETAFVDSDTPLENVAAEVLTGPGREFEATGQPRAELAARITCRWFPGLEAAWRIVHGADVYDIATWDTDITGRREYRIKCTAGASAGD